MDRLYKHKFVTGKEVSLPKYNNIDQTVESSDYSRHIQTTHDYIADPASPNRSTGHDSLHALIKSLENLEIHPENIERPCYVSQLPDEILTLIARHLLMSNRGITTFLNTWPLISQKFLCIYATHSLWQQLCCITFMPILPELQVRANWRDYYIDNPAIRFDGIYISTCNYIRPGLSDTTWNNPIWVVTYFRFVRFFQDGRCLTCLTTREPKDVVHSIDWSTKESTDTVTRDYSRDRDDEEGVLRGLSRGVWSAGEKGEIFIKSKGHRNYIFLMELEVCHMIIHETV